MAGAPARSSSRPRVRAPQRLIEVAAGRKPLLVPLAHSRRSLVDRALRPRVAVRSSRSRHRSRRRLRRDSRPSSNRRLRLLVRTQMLALKPSLVPRLRAVQRIPARQLRARKPQVRYPCGIRLHRSSARSRCSRGWVLVRRPTGLRATRLFRLFSRCRAPSPRFHSL
jgi:hypothetical protein